MRHRIRDRLSADLMFRRGDRWWADLRAYSDVGGKREPLCPPGASLATKVRTEAERILSRRVATLDSLRTGQLSQDPWDVKLIDYADRHLKHKATTRRPATVRKDRLCLDRFMGWAYARGMGEIRLPQVTTPLLNDYALWRSTQGMAAQTVLHDLHSLSSLFKRAMAEGYISYNPVALVDKPKIDRAEAVWLEQLEARKVLDAAKSYDWRHFTYYYPLIAMHLYTGARAMEVLGMTRGDLGIKTIRIVSNQHRKLKRTWHHRHVPMYPELAEALSYLPPGTLGERIWAIKDWRGALGTILRNAGITKHVTAHTFRHTFAAHRIQCLDEVGNPISPYTVMRELGHQGLGLIEKVYGHLPQGGLRQASLQY